jgi:hypothetical protein
MVERKLDWLFRYRHEVTARSLTGRPDKTTSG